MKKTQLTSNFIKHTSNDPSRKFFIKRFYSSLFSLIKPLKPINILDAGSGEGFTLNQIKKNKIGKSYQGVDISGEAVKLANKNFPSFNIVNGDIYKLPYKDNSFDLVICSEVLEHLKEPEKALKEIIRVSNKNIVISVPHEPLFRLSRMLRGLNITAFGNHPEHINHWGIQSFKKFIPEEGNIKIRKVKTSFPWMIFLIRKSV